MHASPELLTPFNHTSVIMFILMECVICLLLQVKAGREVLLNMFPPFQNYEFEELPVIEVSAFSVIHCAQISLLRQDSVGFHFSTSKECSVYHKKSLTISKSSNDSFNFWKFCGICATDYPHRYGRSCYHLETTNLKNYTEARDLCEKSGGSLARISSLEKFTFVRSLLNSVAVNVYIDGKYITENNQFQYADNSPVTWFSWYPNEPSRRPNEDCIALKASYDFNMNDCYCYKVWVFLCERNSC